jgi:replication factor C subunit 3/5
MNENLPFVEKFRPIILDNVLSQDMTIRALKKFIENDNMPHLLFYGPPGTGKTSTINAVINELYGVQNVQYMTMTINASDERGIEIVRNKIKPFISSYSLCNTTDNNIPSYKFVILDEADAITQSAQKMLKKIIEEYTDRARFCLICNCIKYINSALQSRCILFNFSPLNFDSVNKKIIEIAKENNFNITKNGIETIWRISNGDMRKVLHMLQVISINNDTKKIDSQYVCSFQKYPYEEEIKDLYNILIKKNFKQSNIFFENLMKEKNYSLLDILSEIIMSIIKDIISNKISRNDAIKLIKNLRECENNIIITNDTQIQMTNIISVFSL